MKTETEKRIETATGYEDLASKVRDYAEEANVPMTDPLGNAKTYLELARREVGTPSGGVFLAAVRRSIALGYGEISSSRLAREFGAGR